MKKHNRHLLRQLGVVLVTAAMMLSIAACGQGSTFDASGYVDATMKTVTTGDTSALDAYSKEAVTDLADTYWRAWRGIRNYLRMCRRSIRNCSPF